MRDIELGHIEPTVISGESGPTNTSHTSPAVATGSAQDTAGVLTQRNVPDAARSAGEEASPPGNQPEKFDMIEYFRQRGEDEAYNSFAFLLWGSEDSQRGDTWAVDVPLTDLGAEEKAMQKLAATYREVRGLLGSCFYLRAGVRIKPVKFRLAYRDTGKFRASVTGPVPVTHEKHKLRAKLEEAKKAFDEKYLEECEAHDKAAEEEEEPEICCFRDDDDYGHKSYCWRTEIGTVLNLLNDKLQWWESIELLSLFFRNPVSLKGQKVLVGPVCPREIRYISYKEVRLAKDSMDLELNDRRENLTYDYTAFYSPSERDEVECARLLGQSPRYVEFTGLFVTDAWIMHRCVSVLVCSAVLLVLTSKFVLGTWEAAFSAGSFFLAVPMLAMAALAYFK